MGNRLFHKFLNMPKNVWNNVFRNFSEILLYALLENERIRVNASVS